MREMAPEWTTQDTRRATLYVHDLLDTINTWDDREIRSRMEELRREDPVFSAVVYSLLPRPIRALLNGE